MRTSALLGPLTAAILLAGSTAAASAAPVHSVSRGETLTSIAAADGLSVGQLAAANGLAPTAELTSGARLIIPPRGASAIAASSASEASAQSDAVAASPTAQTAAPVSEEVGGSGDLLVVPGATLSAIAASHGTTVAALAAANGLSPDGLLLAGRRLVVPAASAPAATQSAVETSPAPQGAPVASASGAGGSEPVAETVTPSEVGLIAEQEGISPALAEAVADQESGFSDAEVSRTGATGVMQIEPGTWRELSAGGSLQADSALDNVRGGVQYLHDLLADTGGDATEAIASYYQGLGSVRARGMLPGTRRYVADVLALEGRY